jgi:hypothetical protein
MVIITDKILEPCLKAGITPDKFNIIACTCEFHYDIIKFFANKTALKWAEQIEVRTFLIGGNQVEQWLQAKGYKVVSMGQSFEALSLGNVGGISYYLAKLLGCDEVCLIGMDHSQTLEFLDNFPKEIQDNFFIIKSDHCMDPMYQYFTKTFLQFSKIFKIRTINCTEVGSLYDDDIIKMPFKEFLIAKG